MAQMIDRLSASNDLTEIAERASFFKMLMSALKPQRKSQELPTWLYADLGLQPSRERECVRRSR